MKHFLYKCSSPGWKKELGSELEAKEMLYNHICSTCLLDIAYEQATGSRGYFGMVGEEISTEVQAIVDCLKLPEAYQVDINDLLFTACGCEYLYEEVSDD